MADEKKSVVWRTVNPTTTDESKKLGDWQFEEADSLYERRFANLFGVEMFEQFLQLPAEFQSGHKIEARVATAEDIENFAKYEKPKSYVADLQNAENEATRLKNKAKIDMIKWVQNNIKTVEDFNKLLTNISWGYTTLEAAFRNTDILFKAEKPQTRGGEWKYTIVEELKLNEGTLRMWAEVYNSKRVAKKLDEVDVNEYVKNFYLDPNERANVEAATDNAE